MKGQIPSTQGVIPTHPPVHYHQGPSFRVSLRNGVSHWHRPERSLSSARNKIPYSNSSLPIIYLSGGKRTLKNSKNNVLTKGAAASSSRLPPVWG